ncbi:MAG: bifunctional phosphoribosylaminoimidazolecarboxamide formyltransferase/IMP cyclohydrolase, partial [Ignavibacteriae bacterium]|nr:bifunctional phosphoribosylaminoimidazolecarboxamide formyltransferase/IMP cyclohydrolase [Ignavibacteriota bacterium]
MPLIRRALISVSDKRGLTEFAKALCAMNVEIISTGGTYAVLRDAGVNVRTVSEITHFPEILDGRVKTLHPKIHGGLLAVADNEQHKRQLEEHGIEPIDMVVVNLYPFEQTVAREDVSLDEATEEIDIGGPAMIRAAAKNFKHKAVIVNPNQYASILDELQTTNAISESTCFALAREVFHHTATYDTAIAAYMDRIGEERESLPRTFHVTMQKEMNLRYGENPHQHAALYGNFGSAFQQLHGKELSYNNILDIAAAASLVTEFDEPAVAIIKHTNPCGVGCGNTVLGAYTKALATDPTSAFGGIVATNRPLDMEAAQKINEIFTEVIVAPDYDTSALEFLKKKKDRRIMRTSIDLRTQNILDVKSVPGGLLVQEPDTMKLDLHKLNVV